MFLEICNCVHVLSEAATKLLAPELDNECFTVLLPRFVDSLAKRRMDAEPLKPTIFAVLLPRLVDEVLLMAAGFELDVTNREVLVP